jgi:hypothetical protein
LLNAIAQASKENHQTAISGKFEKQLKDYESKFTPVLGKQQQ